MKKILLTASPLLLMLAACSAPADNDDAPAPPEPSAETGATDDAASDAVDSDVADSSGSNGSQDVDERSEERAAPGTMPLAMRGTFARAEVGDPDPTGRACNPAYAFDKVITIREDGYSLFETGGRITEVEVQSRNSIYADFDTTYADTPTSSRERFAVSDEGRTLRRSIVGENGETIRYRRCAGA